MSNKRVRTPLKTTMRGEDISDLLESSDLNLPKATQEPLTTESTLEVIKTKQTTGGPAKTLVTNKKPRGIDPYKGSTKLDAYAAQKVVEAIKWLAAEDGRSQGFIVRKYLDIEGLFRDACAGGFEETNY